MSPRRKPKWKQPQTMQSFIEPLPTDKLIWLARASIAEIQKRLTAPQRASNAGPDVEVRLHPNGRTLR